MKQLNAVVRSLERVSGNLYLVEVQPVVMPRFRAGQYLEIAFPRGGETWLNRHYSIASPPSAPALQFYITGGDDDVATTWPKVGEQLWISESGLGVLSLDALTPGRIPIMVSTGTGIAPFLSMLRERPPAHAVLLHGVRHKADLTFSDELRSIAGLRFIPVTSREASPEDGATGHVQDVLDPARFQALTQLPLDPSGVELLLCGNPEMIRDLAVRLATFTLHYDRYW